MKYCQWFYRLDEQEEALWGKESLDLAIISRSGVSIPPGFVIGREAMQAFFAVSTTRRSIEKACRGLVIENAGLFSVAAGQIRKIILDAELPKPLQTQIQNFWETLGDHLVHGKKMGLSLHLRAADGLRSDWMIIDSVKNCDELFALLKQLYALSFDEQALFARYHQGRSIVPTPFPVLVQYYPKPESSGLGYCCDWEKMDESTITIRAVHHQRAAASKGLQLEDIFRVDRKTLLMLSRAIEQHWWTEHDGNYVSPSHIGKTEPTLEDTKVIQLARQLKIAQAPFHEVATCEWVYAHQQFFVTGIQLPEDDQILEDGGIQAFKPLVLGIPLAVGWAVGQVRCIRSKDDQTAIQEGEVVVLDHLPSQTTWLRGAAALICESGIRPGVEAAVAAQLGIPAVGGVGDALSHFRNGQLVTVDGAYGAVYAGAHPHASQRPHSCQSTVPVTGTKVYATVIDPQLIGREELQYADGIGLLRSEFLLHLLGIHPRDILQRNLAQEYTEILADELESAVRMVSPRPVMYQLHDLASVELIGYRERHQDRFEPNPTLGYRGSHRLLAEPELLGLELGALTKLSKKGLSNVSIVMPMTRTLEEVVALMQYIQASEFGQLAKPKIWVKCETPSMAILAEELCAAGIAGLLLDIPALAQLVLGIDQSNMQMAHHLDQADQALSQAVRYAIETARYHGVATVLVSEMLELRPEMIQLAVEAGLTGVSVTPRRIVEMHGLLAAIEQKMLLNHLIGKEAK